MVQRSDRKRSPRPDLELESQEGYPGRLVIGVDEVGRGCIAGAVVAGAVCLPERVDYEASPWIAEIADSKLLTPAVRLRLEPLIRGWVRAGALGVATVEEIDRINIYQASHLAMVRAVEALEAQLGFGAMGPRAGVILIDGNAAPRELVARPGWRVRTVIKGDQKSLSIAAGSILAKVWRDRQMEALEAQSPGYGFDVHKGYGTPAHLRELQARGATSAHRRSFAPVAAVLKPAEAVRAEAEETAQQLLEF